jgi:hypothetical protein
METAFLITSSSFSPTPAELDEEDADYINPGVFALELADFLARELELKGYTVRFRCQEDWGHWLELKHDGKYTLAVCCANTGETIDGKIEHRVFLEPRKPFVRRFFKKIDVQRDVEKLFATLKGILGESDIIDSVMTEEAD